MPKVLEEKTFYGQILKFIELPEIVAEYPNNLLPRKPIILAAIATFKPVAQNRLKFPYLNGSATGVEVIDVSCIECVVGRVKDRNRWAIIERTKVMGTLNDGSEL